MNHCQVWDAIVVGAGPSGCAAAYDLAAGGVSVLLLDKSQFPRPKACAGGLTIKTVEALRYSIAQVTRQVIHRMKLEGPDPDSPASGSRGSGSRATLSRRPVLLKSRRPICVMTVRTELDAFCLQQTIKAGAFFRRISSIRKIVTGADTVSVATEDEQFTARFLVGADGVNSQVRRLCADGPWFSRAFALEVKMSMPPDVTDLTFDFTPMTNGYGWIFPKGDHLNVGLYSHSTDEALSRKQLLAYVELKVGKIPAEHIVGQYLGLGAWSSDGSCPAAQSRVLLVGDAAGFVDPLTGEGIYGAVISGQAAASALLADKRGDGIASEVFARELAPYRKMLAFSSRAAEAFYPNRERGFRALRLPLLRGSLVKTYSHGLNLNRPAMRIALSLC